MDGRGSATRWEHLDPDEALVRALDKADEGGARAQLLSSGDGKTQWSNRFADACARMVARELAGHREIKRLGLTVLPDDQAAEPPTFVTGGKKKRVDVIAASVGAGLQLGFSLKGGNFRDREGRNFDKNLTGRLYELGEEMQQIHSYQPSAFMVALYFLPMGSTCDKVNGSSFAHAVQALRARTGRTDHLAAGQMSRCDMSVVALYSPGDAEDYAYGENRKGGPFRFEYADAFPRGVVRYFDVDQDPPKSGRPMLGTTMALHEMVDAAVARYRGEAVAMTWAPAEPDDEAAPAVGPVDTLPILDEDSDDEAVE